MTALLDTPGVRYVRGSIRLHTCCKALMRRLSSALAAIILGSATVFHPTL